MRRRTVPLACAFASLLVPARALAVDVATADVRLCGTIVTADPTTGRSTAVERLCVTEADLPALEAQKPA